MRSASWRKNDAGKAAPGQAMAQPCVFVLEHQIGRDCQRYQKMMDCTRNLGVWNIEKESHPGKSGKQTGHQQNGGTAQPMMSGHSDGNHAGQNHRAICTCDQPFVAKGKKNGPGNAKQNRGHAAKNHHNAHAPGMRVTRVLEADHDRWGGAQRVHQYIVARTCQLGAIYLSRPEWLTPPELHPRAADRRRPATRACHPPGRFE